MPTLQGSLRTVTGSPSTAVGVSVHAKIIRADDGEIILTEKNRVPVHDGEFTVSLEPGPAVITVIHDKSHYETFQLLVADGQTTIAEAMQAAAVAHGQTKSALEDLVTSINAARDAAIAAAERAEAANGGGGGGAAKPEGGWTRDDLAPDVRAAIDDVTGAVSDINRPGAAGKLLRLNDFGTAVVMSDQPGGGNMHLIGRSFVTNELFYFKSDIKGQLDEIRAQMEQSNSPGGGGLFTGMVVLKFDSGGDVRGIQRLGDTAAVEGDRFGSELIFTRETQVQLVIHCERQPHRGVDIGSGSHLSGEIFTIEPHRPVDFNQLGRPFQDARKDGTIQFNLAAPAGGRDRYREDR